LLKSLGHVFSPAVAKSCIFDTRDDLRGFKEPR